MKKLLKTLGLAGLLLFPTKGISKENNTSLGVTIGYDMRGSMDLGLNLKHDGLKIYCGITPFPYLSPVEIIKYKITPKYEQMTEPLKQTFSGKIGVVKTVHKSKIDDNFGKELGIGIEHQTYLLKDKKGIDYKAKTITPYLRGSITHQSKGKISLNGDIKKIFPLQGNLSLGGAEGQKIWKNDLSFLNASINCNF